MKKIHIITILVAVFIFMMSCSESLLDLNPTNKYTEDIFWKSETQADAGLAACYETLRNTGIYGGGGWTTPLWEETATPNATDYNSSSGFYQIGGGTHDASNTGIINNRWGHSYEGIGRCNTLIDRIGDIAMSETKKTTMIAEAKFLRAVYYSLLINYYGDAPLILEAPKLEHKTLPRTPKDQIFTQIIKDLDEAAAVLPVNAAMPGKPTKGACYALKARQYLYHGKFSEAATSAKQVMDMNKYSLFPDYRALFMPENENNQEVIFDVQYLYPNYCHSFDLINRQYNTNAPLRDLVDAYLMKDGSTIEESADYNAATYWENRDPRFRMTLVWPGSKYMGKTVTNTQFAQTGYTFKKYGIYDEDNQYNKVILNASESDINYIVLRYADILLMYAEAKTELNEVDQSVFDAFNLVRTRAGMPGLQSTDPSLPTYVAMGDQEEMRKAIRLERRIEFAAEGYYYMDILRWKIAHIVNNGPIFTYNYTQKLVRKFTNPRDYLWPVPSYEIQENPALAPNNAGW
ncbi:MAG TPA: RagB/SusD family nutrient uptake outer membrane protein [Bacteroidales bacterium]|nr:RagB/SusD family nutrient uptake outer membrane protein [Bacteroidales bacterium]HPM88614.1 RagB/SusD family nutrient uptake outer membrane protein [Bacteroidales bacterium]